MKAGFAVASATYRNASGLRYSTNPLLVKFWDCISPHRHQQTPVALATDLPFNLGYVKSISKFAVFFILSFF
jgi:hypothetical protein